MRWFDLIIAGWIAALFMGIFFWLPARCYFAPKDDLSYRLIGGRLIGGRLIGGLARSAAIIIIGAPLLARTHLLNWLTLILLYAVGPILSWLFAHRGRLRLALKRGSEEVAFTAVDALERGFKPKTPILARLRNQQYRIATYLRQVRVAPMGLLALGAFTIALTFTLMTRFQQPLQELRLSRAENYQTLLTTRQMISGDAPSQGQPCAFAALAATISIIGAADPMQVIRFLAPLLGGLLTLIVCYCLLCLSGRGMGALAAMFSLGAYVFTLPKPVPNINDQLPQNLFAIISENLNGSLARQWAGGEFELGALFLLLALVIGWNISSSSRRSLIIDFIACLIIVALTAPPLLLIVLAAAIMRLIMGGKNFTGTVCLIVTTLSWLTLALLAALPGNRYAPGMSALATLPIALALFCGLIFNLIGYLFDKILRARAFFAQAMMLALFFAISINLLLPREIAGHYLEQEMAARKTIEIAARFPRKRWLLVAPVEQFAESYGEGWHEDLAQFVDKFGQQAGDANFHFDFPQNDLFVYVEKQPFAAFSVEPQTVAFDILSDPTYRYYRSPAGRASLEFAALKLCEAYRLSHAGTSIYYEDDALRIYHFPLAQKE
jgi:hypothetical protein